MSLLRRRMMMQWQFIDGIPIETNLIDFDTLAEGFVLNGTTGEEMVNASWSTTGFIEIEYGQSYEFSGISRGRFAFYNKDYELIYCRTTHLGYSTYITPETKYTRLSFLNEDVETVIFKQIIS